MRVSNILLALDIGLNCRAALRRALALARNEEASLTVCTVLDSIPPDYRRGIVVVTPNELIDLAAADTLERLQEFVCHENINDMPVTTKVLIGKPHVEIAHQVQTYQFDLVIKAVTPQYRIASRTLRRADRKLMRTCPCPLWLVPPEYSDVNGPILAALDLDSSDAVMSDVNRTLLRTSTALALAEFREMHIVHAWNAAHEKVVTKGHAVSRKASTDDTVADQTEMRRRWLRALIDTSNVTSSDRIAMRYLSPSLHVINGHPKQVIPDIANKLNASLLVIGTAARSGIAGFLTGNTSEKVLTALNCSLLIVKTARIHGCLQCYGVAEESAQIVVRSWRAAGPWMIGTRMTGKLQLPPLCAHA